MDVVIEPERPDDVVAVRSLVRRAFHHHQSVSDMVELIRASPQYVPELALVARADRDVDASGSGLVTLEGSPTYDGRLGFRPAPDFGITIDLPDWAPPQAAQVHPLRTYDSRVRGKLEYPPAFAAAAE